MDILVIISILTSTILFLFLGVGGTIILLGVMVATRYTLGIRGVEYLKKKYLITFDGWVDG
jgi:hypothetical protein